MWAAKPVRTPLRTRSFRIAFTGPSLLAIIWAHHLVGKFPAAPLGEGPIFENNMSEDFIVKIGGIDHTFRVYPPTYDGRPANVLVNIPITSGGLLIHDAEKFRDALTQAIYTARQVQNCYDLRLAEKRRLQAVKKRHEIFTAERYCDHCHDDTPHKCREFNHERDDSQDWRKCQVCQWEYNGFSHEYESPRRGQHGNESENPENS